MNPTHLRPTTLAAIALAGAASMATSPAFWGTHASATLGEIALAPGSEIARTVLVLPEFEVATPAGYERWGLDSAVVLADTATAATLAIAIVEGGATIGEAERTVTATTPAGGGYLSFAHERSRPCAPCAGAYTLRVTNRSAVTVRLVEPTLRHASEAPFDFDLGAPAVRLIVSE